ncbi:YciI family protein [Oceanicaulis sp. MMSF_3324]|uniref:YciI family protein n=1 Tax=Oceanicaulis sp. MMSF_3324 TaxID=3046702 RepID=UPI00273D0C92|nr:YciI family protein [Oceanicaulis sp. MMSF_3324]
MQFALLIYESACDFARRRGPEAAAYWSSWAAYSGALDDQVCLGACLQTPDTGVVFRRNGAMRRISDGPYSDSPEQLGGVIMLDMDSVEDALSWAERCPAARNGAVEVRPLQFISNSVETVI